MKLSSVRSLKQELLHDTRLPGPLAEAMGQNPSSQLRKVAEGRGEELGDVSTLADPSVVEAIKGGFEGD